MKLFVLFLFAVLPWVPWIGDWALRWTEGNEALQIAFAMFIFPLAMNAIQVSPSKAAYASPRI